MVNAAGNLPLRDFNGKTCMKINNWIGGQYGQDQINGNGKKLIIKGCKYDKKIIIVKHEVL